jgi:hypothetical protein
MAVCWLFFLSEKERNQMPLYGIPLIRIESWMREKSFRKRNARLRWYKLWFDAISSVVASAFEEFIACR